MDAAAAGDVDDVELVPGGDTECRKGKGITGRTGSEFSVRPIIPFLVRHSGSPPGRGSRCSPRASGRARSTRLC